MSISSGRPDHLIASVEAIVQENLTEQRRLTDGEIQHLMNCAWQLTGLDDEFFGDYKSQFCSILNEAREKAAAHRDKMYYYALMVEFRLRQQKH